MSNESYEPFSNSGNNQYCQHRLDSHVPPVCLTILIFLLTTFNPSNPKP